MRRPVPELRPEETQATRHRYERAIALGGSVTVPAHYVTRVSNATLQKLGIPADPTELTFAAVENNEGLPMSATLRVTGAGKGSTRPPNSPRQVLKTYEKPLQPTPPHQAHDQLPPDAQHPTAAHDLDTRRLHRTRILGGLTTSTRRLTSSDDVSRDTRACLVSANTGVQAPVPEVLRNAVIRVCRDAFHWRRDLRALSSVAVCRKRCATGMTCLNSASPRSRTWYSAISTQSSIGR
jgi:hypothetical protein